MEKQQQSIARGESCYQGRAIRNSERTIYRSGAAVQYLAEFGITARPYFISGDMLSMQSRN